MNLPTVHNLVPTPLGAAVVVTGNDDTEDMPVGGVLVRGCRVVEGHDDGLAVRGWRDKTNGFLAPGGGRGDFRLGMQPGRTYTASVTFALPGVLSGPHEPDRLSLGAYAEVGGSRDRIASSFRVPAEPGRYRAWLTFRVPEDATGAWLRIDLGTAREYGVVSLHDLCLTETPVPVPHFDGSTPADRWYTYAWSGEPGRSASIRTMTDPSACFEADDVDGVLLELARRAREVLVSEATALREHLSTVVGGASSTYVEVADLLIAEATANAGLVGLTAVERRERSKTLLKDTNAQLRALVRDPEDAPPAVNGVIGRRLLREYSANNALSYLQHADASVPLFGYALGLAHERTGDIDGMTEVLTTTVSRDTDAPVDVAAMLTERGKRLGARREVAAFLEPRMAHLRERADTDDLAIGDLGESPVFMYWGQGFADAPPVVEACRRQLELLNPDANLHFLDNRNLETYAALPDRVLEGTDGQWAARADAIRLDLLARYGGTWLDATCYPTAPLADFVVRGDSPLFAPRFSPHRVASWLLSAPLSSYVVRLQRAAFFSWWDERDDLVDYYLFHHVFEALCHLDERFAAEWATCPSIPSAPAHALGLAMRKPGSMSQLPELLPHSPVHKLSYHRGEDVPLDSALAALCRRTGVRLD